MSFNKYSIISNDSIVKATGKSWKQWFGLLDQTNAKELSHPDIVKLIETEFKLDKHWWRQSIANAYEKYTGRRVAGQTADAGFQIGVQKTIDVPAKEIWKLLTSDEGLKLWLNPTASLDSIRFEKGADYETPDGTKGQIRSLDENRKIRLTRRQAKRAAPSTIQIYLECPRNTPDKTNVRFHQEKLASQKEREDMRKHWKNVLNKIERQLNR